MKYTETKEGLLVLLFLYLTGSIATQNDLIVHIEQGSIKGTTLTSIRSTRTFFGFMGIPYAQPPVGDLRFKPPQPAKPWSGVRDAKIEGSVCPHLDFLNNTYIGNEDCLFINVFTPQLPSRKNNVLKPVMVWIHGGGYIVGSGNRKMHGPDFLVDEDIVFVSFNYRLGVLGFLSLQNSEVPGNNAMKDQVLALHWIKKNIEKFGGDPNKITIFGESSGASCVHFHQLSPLSAGLFNQVISQSGVALNPWAYQTPENSVKLAVELGIKFGAKSEDPHDILEKLKTVKPKELVDFIHKKALMPHNEALIGPTVDNKAAKGEVFLPDAPNNLINSGKFLKIPYLLGVNNEEMLIIAKTLENRSWLLKLVTASLAIILETFIGGTIPKLYDMAAEVKQKYFNNDKPLVLQYVDVFTDLHFVNGAYCTAQKEAALSSSAVYAYEFSFNGTANVMKQFFNASKYPGACHGDELPYLFRMDTMKVKIKKNTPEYTTSSRLVKLWTNFAKTGNPTPKADPLLQDIILRPVTKSSFPSLSIDTNLKIKEGLNNGNGVWWEQLYHKYIPNATPCWPHLK